MIYLNSDIINKIGNSNRLYYNGSIVYQSYTTGGEPVIPDIPEGDYSLPDVPFMFNYNARDYVDGVIPNADGALFNYNMVLNNPNVVVYNGDYIAVNGKSYFQYQYPSINENPFNCGSSNSQMTIIAKVRTNREDGQIHLFANRSDTGGYGGTYNWMLRIGGSCDVAWLHTSDYNNCSNTVRVPITYDQPNIFAIRLLSDNKGYGQNYTLNEVDEVRDAGFTDYSYSSRIAILNGSYSGENFFGDFYWLYCSKEQLTDEQIQQVIEYNENKAFEPVVPPVEPEPDEPETPEIPEGMISLQYCWDNSIFNIPFRECYIDMNNVEDDLPTNYFICLSETPDTQYASTTTYSICPKENSIFDAGNPVGNYWRMYIMEGFYNGNYNDTPVVATPLGNGIYYYKFNQPVYLSNKSDEANAPYWRVNVIPLTIEPEIPDTPIIPDEPDGSKELVVTSITRGYVGGSEYEVMFILYDGSTIVIDYYNSNPLATGEYSMDNGYSDFGIIKMYTNWNGNALDTCNSVVTNNGNNNYDFYVEFTLNGDTYHFTYNGDL